MKRYLLVLALLLFCFAQVSFAQNKKQKAKIDKYEKLLSKAEGAKKIEYLDILAEVYLDINSRKSVDYVEKALKLSKKTPVSDKQKASLYNTLGAAYYYQKNYKKSAQCYEDELEITRKGGSQKSMAESQYNIATIYLKSDKDKKAEEYYLKSLDISKRVNSQTLMMMNYKALFNFYLNQKKYKEALDNYQAYIGLKDIRIKQETTQQISILRRDYKEEKVKRETAEKVVEVQTEKIHEKDSTLTVVKEEKVILEKDTLEKATKISTLTLEKEYQEQQLVLKQTALDLSNAINAKQRRTIIFLFLIALIIGGASIWLYYLLQQIKKKNVILNEQKEEIKAQAEEITEKANELSHKNIQITESITYASRIQGAMMVPESDISIFFPDNFLIFRPKDIVSGDFYWLAQVNGTAFAAVVDCTGHGVPGAFMSMIGNRLLNEIVLERDILYPSEILEVLDTEVKKALRQEQSSNRDGMDLCLVAIDKIDNKHVKITFSGAKNNLYYYDTDKLQIQILKADRRTIGGGKTRNTIKFTNQELILEKGDLLYLTSDGIIDQNDKERNRYGTQKFLQILLDNVEAKLEKQKSALISSIEYYMRGTEQRDDITIVGIKL